jgi:hypothetical protein
LSDVVECEHCGGLVPEGDLRRVSGQLVCPRCVGLVKAIAHAEKAAARQPEARPPAPDFQNFAARRASAARAQRGRLRHRLKGTVGAILLVVLLGFIGQDIYGCIVGPTYPEMTMTAWAALLEGERWKQEKLPPGSSLDFRRYVRKVGDLEAVAELGAQRDTGRLEYCSFGLRGPSKCRTKKGPGFRPCREALRELRPQWLEAIGRAMDSKRRLSDAFLRMESQVRCEGGWRLNYLDFMTTLTIRKDNPLFNVNYVRLPKRARRPASEREFNEVSAAIRAARLPDGDALSVKYDVLLMIVQSEHPQASFEFESGKEGFAVLADGRYRFAQKITATTGLDETAGSWRPEWLVDLQAKGLLPANPDAELIAGLREVIAVPIEVPEPPPEL